MFLNCKDGIFSYDDFLVAVNNQNNFCPCFQTDNLFNYWVNLIIGLVSNNSITLIDSDFTTEEIKNLGLEEINVPIKIEKPKFSTMTDLLNKIRESRSEIVIFTSGTTGQPKRISHSYENLVRNVKTGERFKDNIWGFAYNPTHMAGIQVFLQALENCNTIIDIFSLKKEEIYQSIQSFHITNISATPTFYRLLLPSQKHYDSVKHITFGGEKSDNVLYESIAKVFPNAKITNVYASTEAGSLFSSHGSDFKIPDSIKDKIKVIGDELYVHQSLIGTSTTLTLNNQYYPTGDLIEWIDEEKGLFRFKSRKNELINVGGYKVNPNEVEEVIRSIGGIKEVRVFGKPNSVLGYVLCAEVVKSNNNDLSELSMKSYLKKFLQEFKVPRRIKFVDNISMTRTGKLKRQ